jgi:hypothetical protein
MQQSHLTGAYFKQGDGSFSNSHRPWSKGTFASTRRIRPLFTRWIEAKFGPRARQMALAPLRRIDREPTDNSASLDRRGAERISILLKDGWQDVASAA